MIFTDAAGLNYKATLDNNISKGDTIIDDELEIGTVASVEYSTLGNYLLLDNGNKVLEMFAVKLKQIKNKEK